MAEDVWTKPVEEAINQDDREDCDTLETDASPSHHQPPVVMPSEDMNALSHSTVGNRYGEHAKSRPKKVVYNTRKQGKSESIEPEYCVFANAASSSSSHPPLTADDRAAIGPAITDDQWSTLQSILNAIHSKSSKDNLEGQRAVSYSISLADGYSYHSEKDSQSSEAKSTTSVSDVPSQLRNNTTSKRLRTTDSSSNVESAKSGVGSSSSKATRSKKSKGICWWFSLGRK